VATPLVSVLIPTYDRREAVVGAIDSALAQTVRDLEVLVVDDGSRDGTGTLLAERYGSEPRVRVLRKPNGGCAAARNHGLDASRGAYVGLLDSDDRWRPDFAERQVALLRGHPDAWMAVADGSRASTAGARRLSEWPDFHLSPTLDEVFRGAWSLPSGWMLVGQRLRALRFDGALRRCEDLDLSIRLLASGGRIVGQPEVLWTYSDVDAGPEEPRLTEDRAALWRAVRGVFERHLALAPDARAARRRIHKLERDEARALLASGRAAEARPLLRRWLLRRPFDRAAWRAFLAGRRGG
jgi:glycosyltransferase involved in cell wall biosynthesis